MVLLMAHLLRLMDHRKDYWWSFYLVMMQATDKSVGSKNRQWKEGRYNNTVWLCSIQLTTTEVSWKLIKKLSSIKKKDIRVKKASYSSLTTTQIKNADSRLRDGHTFNSYESKWRKIFIKHNTKIIQLRIQKQIQNIFVLRQ